MFPLCPLLPAVLTFLVHGILSTTTVWFFKACPLSALLWQEITLEGGRRIREVCMGFIEAVAVIHWESFHPSWVAHTSPTWHSLSETDNSWGFCPLRFILHHLPPAPSVVTHSCPPSPTLPLNRLKSFHLDRSQNFTTIISLMLKQVKQRGVKGFFWQARSSQKQATGQTIQK